MPEKNPGESRSHFMERCVPQLIGEGKDPDQAVAICSNLFSGSGEHKMGWTKFSDYIVKLDDDDQVLALDNNTTDLVLSHAVSKGMAYAPQIDIKFDEVMEQMSEHGEHESQVRVLLVRGIPITPGVHRGIKFSESIISTLPPLLENAPILVDHKFNQEFRSIKGKVVKVDAQGADILVTAMITDEETIQRIQSGELHSFSVRILVTSNEDKEAVRIHALGELTVTGVPIDKRAIITDQKEIAVPIQLSTPSTTIEIPSPPLDLPEAESEIGGISLSEENNTNNENNPGAVPTPVQLSEATSATQTPQEIQLAEQVRTLQEQNNKLLEAQKILLAHAKAQKVANDVKGWVKNGKLPPAAEDRVKKFAMNLSEEGYTEFSEIIALNSVAPLGGIEAQSAGMVPTQKEGTGATEPEIDWTKFSDEELELIYFSQATDGYDAMGFNGAEAQRRHMKGGLFNVFPVKGVEQ